MTGLTRWDWRRPGRRQARSLISSAATKWTARNCTLRLKFIFSIYAANRPWTAGLQKKVIRVLAYYGRLLAYAVTAEPKIFHILWNNKFEIFDRTVLMLYYRLLGKKIVFTAHNVNAGVRDAGDSWLNRATLKFQYHWCDHIFLHTEKMRAELVAEFGVPDGKTTVIPFGLNSTVPDTALTSAGARQRLGLAAAEKVLLFFGNIAPYKGVEYLVDAFIELAARRVEIAASSSRAGPKAKRSIGPGCSPKSTPARTRPDHFEDRICARRETEIYFKAADVLVLPYTHIFQSGVLFLGYNFGLPAIAADVGSFKEEIIAGRTGLVFQPRERPVWCVHSKNISPVICMPICPSAARTSANLPANATLGPRWRALTTAVYKQLGGI